MKEFIDKLIERLEELKELHAELIKDGLEEDYHSGCEGMCVDIIEIVNELAEEYKGGWIPVSERFPERNKNVLCWAKSTARCGDACFVGSCDNGFWFLQTAVDTLSYPTQYEVVAWCELPAPYTEGE